MPCPTCDHTMQRIHEGLSIYWCPRCGTVKSNMVDGITEEGISPLVPKLVERCRQFEKTIPPISPSAIVIDWKRLGIEESINVPENRKPE